MAGTPTPLAIAIWLIAVCVVLAALASFLEGKIAVVALILIGVVIGIVEYTPSHPRDRLERALRIPALSAGWRKSFELLLEQQRKDGAASGTPALPQRPGRRRPGADSARFASRANCGSARR
jgi:hypothetical protein